MATKAGGRELPGRLFFPLDVAALAPPLVAAAVVVVTRIPLRTRYLLNWDAAQFALGMRHFDVIHHQPHPPGYLVYVAAGRFLLPFFGDANSALIALSIVGECAGVVVAFYFARELFGAWAGWAAALALAIAPLFWYYGEAANTYALEPLLALLVAWPCWRLWRGDGSWAVPAGLALGLAGSIRPSTAVLLLPLLLWSLRRAVSVSRIALSIGAAAAVTAAWLLPLIALSGGPLAYARSLLQLEETVTPGTSIWSAGLSGLLTLTGPAVARGVMWELGAFAILLFFGLLIAPRLARLAPLPAGWAPFAMLWILPALFTFLLIHIGQVVYVQVFVPALMLTVGPALRNTAAALGRPQLAPALLVACLAINVTFFVLPPRYSLAAQLELHDQRVDELMRVVGQSDPSNTVLLTDAVGVGSYREAQMYLPAYRRIGIGRDQQGRVGEIFGEQYEPWRFDGAGPPDFRNGDTTFVFLDRAIVEAFVADPERLKVVRLPDGSRIYVWRGQAPEIHSGSIFVGPPYRELRGLDA